MLDGVRYPKIAGSNPATINECILFTKENNASVSFTWRIEWFSKLKDILY